MEKINLVLEDNESKLIEESETFTLDEDWQDNPKLMTKISTMVKSANDITKKWHKQNLTDKSAFVFVMVLSDESEIARQVEDHIDELADQTCK